MDTNLVLRALAQAKGVLTRHTRTFIALVQGNRPFTRQQLVTARANMVTACDNMVAELEQLAQMNHPQDHPVLQDRDPQKNDKDT